MLWLTCVSDRERVSLSGEMKHQGFVFGVRGDGEFGSGCGEVVCVCWS